MEPMEKLWHKRKILLSVSEIVSWTFYAVESMIMFLGDDFEMECVRLQKSRAVKFLSTHPHGVAVSKNFTPIAVVGIDPLQPIDRYYSEL